MSGFLFILGHCCACNRYITFAPTKVPSLRIDGVKQPLCRACAEKWNDLHPDVARPIQEGAYEAQPEDEVW